MSGSSTGRQRPALLAPGDVVRRSPRAVAAAQALLVTFLWSTSWVLIKFGLGDIPPLTFAGLRYSLAFLCLLPLMLQRRRMTALRSLSPADWAGLALLGLLYYSVTQGAQFLALAYLPAITVTLTLNLTIVVVALLGILFLGEQPTRIQAMGIVISLAGTLLFFYPVALAGGEITGMLFAAVCLLANSGSSILGRYINRPGTLSPLTVTSVSMGIGGSLLLAAGTATQGLPAIGLAGWAIVLWLAIINTAFAFTLWNHTLRYLSAVESSIINSTMLIQITLLAWIFLGEEPGRQQIAGMLLSGSGAIIVQLRRRQQPPSE